MPDLLSLFFSFGATGNGHLKILKNNQIQYGSVRVSCTVARQWACIETAAQLKSRTVTLSLVASDLVRLWRSNMMHATAAITATAPPTADPAMMPNGSGSDSGGAGV